MSAVFFVTLNRITILHSRKMIPEIDIQKVICDLKDTAYSLKEYLEKNYPDFVSGEKLIYEEIIKRQEIGFCDGCQCWFELGELNEQSECEGCNSLDEE